MRKFLLHLFFPRESNNHRPKVLHLSSLFLLILAISISTFTLTTFKTSHPEVLGVATYIQYEDLLLLTNTERQKENIPPLITNSLLEEAALMKAEDMLKNDYWAHDSPSGVTPWDFIKRAGYDYIYAGENLARGFNTAEEVISAWMASPEHRNNLLSRNYKEVGFAVVKGDLEGEDTVLIVQELGGREIVLPRESPKVETTVRSQNIQKLPSIDTKTTSSKFLIMVLGIIISALIIDLLIIEKKKIVRFAGHNLDHIIFLIMIIISLIILGKGSIL